jgi:hypothetical protein
MVEYVSRGDYHSAVGFLLASPPDRSARYYRDALCTLALAHAAAAVPDGLQSSGGPLTSQHSTDAGTARQGSLGRTLSSAPSVALPQPPPASSLLWQAAKVCDFLWRHASAHDAKGFAAQMYIRSNSVKALLQCPLTIGKHTCRWWQPMRQAWAMHSWASRCCAPQVPDAVDDTGNKATVTSTAAESLPSFLAQAWWRRRQLCCRMQASGGMPPLWRLVRCPCRHRRPCWTAGRHMPCRLVCHQLLGTQHCTCM